MHSLKLEWEAAWALWGEGLSFLSLFVLSRKSAHSGDAVANDMFELSTDTRLQLNNVCISVGEYIDIIYRYCDARLSIVLISSYHEIV